MRRSFTLTYWRDDNCYVGCLEELPGVSSQGETLEDLEENIRDAYQGSSTVPSPSARRIGGRSPPTTAPSGMRA